MNRILLVEANETMRSHLVNMLEKAGYDVTALERSTAAPPLLDTGAFELLLSNVIMAGMDGIELAQHCAQTSPTTRIILITGFAAVTLAATSGATTSPVPLSKPFHLRGLVQEVDQLFSQQAQASI